MKKKLNIFTVLLIIVLILLIGLNLFVIIENHFLINSLNFENYKIKEKHDIYIEDKNNLHNENSVYKENQDVTCNIFIDEQGFYIKDSFLKINGSLPIYLNLKNKHVVEYDSNSSFLLLDDKYFINNIKNENTQYISKGINTFFNTNTNNKIIISQKPFKENTLLFLSYDLLTNEKEEDKYLFMENILENSFIENTKINYNLNELNINNEWTENIIITKDFITLEKDENKVYISKYNGNGTKYFDNQITLKNKTLKYGNYVNKETNNTVYIIDDSQPIQILIPIDVKIEEVFNK